MQIASNSAHSIAHHFLSDSETTRSRAAPRRTSALLRQRPLFPFSLLTTWFRRSRFRAALLTDLTERPHYLSDVGISEGDARIEVTRFFWEPILLKKPDPATRNTLGG